ncbi:hypothetical protein ACH5RR_003074 [Cinchona calisaya]|uniref:Retrotransposon gag domain-containing protein n=1 Tax=Cinchona calisaya TaxID=153742 RepID=A0ABD3ATX1_9GENT
MMGNDVANSQAMTQMENTIMTWRTPPIPTTVLKQPLKTFKSPIGHCRQLYPSFIRKKLSQAVNENIANAPNFEGGPDPNVALNWIAQMETKFKPLRFPEDVKVQVVIPFLIGDAKNWWRSMEPMIDVVENDITLEEFKEMFLDQYFPRALRKKRQNDFYSLRQTGNMTVFQYANKSVSLGRFYPRVFEDEEENMDRFEQCLREEIGCQLTSHKFTTFKNMYDAALAVEMRFKLNEGERNIGKKPRWMMGSNQAAGTRQ